MSESGFDTQPYTFFGKTYTTDEADVVIVPVQFDRTASFKGGAAYGPREIIMASWQLEEYDMEMRWNLADSVKIATHPELAPAIYVYDMICRVEEVALRLLQEGKFVFGLGGDHSLSAGFVRAQKKYRRNPFTILHFDAHSDFRHSYEGSIWSHACVARRWSDWEIPLVQIGIRSTTEDIVKEQEKRRKAGMNISVFPAFHPIFASHYIPDHTVHEILHAIKTTDVYVSIDVDCFDISEIGSSTGTPVPGGLRRRQVENILREVGRQRNIIGGDLVEFRPSGEGTFAYAFSMAELIYKFFTYAFQGSF